MTTCTLCELYADPPVTDEAVDGEFCCRGCLEVYRQLGEVDVEAARNARETNEQSYPEDAESTYLAVDGMHCATCELFLESVASDHDGIYDAEASYAAETIKLAYDPECIDEQELSSVVSGLGYSAREKSTDRPDDAGIASRLLVGGIFSMMAMVWYILFLYPTYFGFDPVVELGTFDSAYLYAQLAVLTAIILLYTGAPMIRSAYVSLRARQPNVDLLVTVAAVAAYLYSTGRLLAGGSDLYYDVTIVVVMAVTIGNYYETRIKRKTAGLLADLAELQVQEATRRDGESISVDTVTAGDELLVKPGERVPVDGTVIEGEAAVDEALVTGESIPETKRPGDSVHGGTVVENDAIVVEAGDEAESTLDRLVGMLWEIQATRPGAQRVADKLAVIFVPLVLVLAAVVAAGALAVGGSLQSAVLVGLTVLIVSCPCALGLATPLAVATGLQSAARRGVVMANATLFERAPSVDTVIFDKTGTLTTGQMGVTDVYTDGCDQSTLHRRAAAVEQYADHPIATAIVNSVERVPATDIAAVEQYTRGVAGTCDGDRVLVGHPGLFDREGWGRSETVDQQIETVEQAGALPVVVGWEGSARGVLAVDDELRPEWEPVVEELGKERDIVVLTGDDQKRASRFQNHAAVDTVYAGMPPEGKAETVRRLSAEGTVAMVGDGSNDAPALAAADVGIALESGTQLASEAADAVVLGDELRRLPIVFESAARTNRRIKENITWAFLYNGIAIPLAITGLLNPLFAAVAMATSSLFVVANSARGTESEAETKELGFDHRTDQEELSKRHAPA